MLDGSSLLCMQYVSEIMAVLSCWLFLRNVCSKTVMLKQMLDPNFANKWAVSWENLFLPYAKNKGADSLGIRTVWLAPLLFAA